MMRTVVSMLLPCLLVASLFGCGTRDNRVVAKATYSASALAELADSSADWLLQRGLEHRDPSVRAQVATTVGHLRHLPLLHEMVRLLDDPDPFVRAASAWALGQIGEPSARASLRQVLYDRHPQVRVRAAGALVLLGGRSAVVQLADALGAKDPAVVKANSRAQRVSLDTRKRPRDTANTCWTETFIMLEEKRVRP